MTQSSEQASASENSAAREGISVAPVVGVMWLADLFGLTDRRIQQLAKDGTIPAPSSRGEYDAIGCIRGYVRFLQERAERSEEPQRVRLDRLRGDREELELAKLRRELIPAGEIAPALEQYVTDVSAALAGIPERFAEVLQAADDVDSKHQILEDLVNEIREHLGGYVFAVKRIDGAAPAAGNREIPAAA